MPDTAEYLERIRQESSVGDPVAMQRETARALGELVSSAPEDRLVQRQQPDKWSVGEILAHLAEDELATAWRYRQMLEHNGAELAGFDQDLWARMGDYASRTPRESLELFRLLRAANVQFLERLSPEQWECCGIHAERGRITIRDLAVHMTGHDANHMEQIRRLLADE
jgi:hypothetical protein